MNRYLEESLSSDKDDCDEKIFVNTPKTRNFKWSHQLETPNQVETPKSLKNVKNPLSLTFNTTSKNVLNQAQIQSDYFISNKESKIDSSMKVEPIRSKENLYIKVTESERIEKAIKREEEREEIFENSNNNTNRLRNLVMIRANKYFSLKSFFDKWLINCLKERSNEYKEKFIKNLRQSLQTPYFEWKEDEKDHGNLLKSMMNIKKKEEVLNISPNLENKELLKRTQVVKIHGITKKPLLTKNKEISLFVPSFSRTQKKIGISNQIQIEKHGKKPVYKNTEIQTENIPSLFKANTQIKERIVRSNNFFKGLEIVKEIMHESVPKFLKKIIITNNQIHYERGFNLLRNEQVESNEIMLEIIPTNKIQNVIIPSEVRIQKNANRPDLVKKNEIQFQSQINKVKKPNLYSTNPINFNIFSKKSSLDEILNQKNMERTPIQILQPPYMANDKKTPSYMLTISSNEKDHAVQKENKQLFLLDNSVKDLSKPMPKIYLYDDKISQTDLYEVILTQETLPFISIEGVEKEEEELIIEEYDSFSIFPDYKQINYYKAFKKLKLLSLLKSIREKALLKQKFMKLKIRLFYDRRSNKSFHNLNGERNVMVTFIPNRSKILKQKSLQKIKQILFIKEYKKKAILLSKIERWREIIIRSFLMKEDIRRNLKEISYLGFSIPCDRKEINIRRGISFLKAIFKRVEKENKSRFGNIFNKWLNNIRIHSYVEEKERKILKELKRKSNFIRASNIVKNIILLNKFKSYYIVLKKRFIDLKNKLKLLDFKYYNEESLSIHHEERFKFEKNAEYNLKILLNKIFSRFKYFSLKEGFELLKYYTLKLTFSRETQRIISESNRKSRGLIKLKNILHFIIKKIISKNRDKFRIWKDQSINNKYTILMKEYCRNENFILYITKKTILKNNYIHFFQRLKKQDNYKQIQHKISQLLYLIQIYINKKITFLLMNCLRKIWKFSILNVKKETYCRNRDKLFNLVRNLRNNNSLFDIVGKIIYTNARVFFRIINYSENISYGIFSLEDIIKKRSFFYLKGGFERICSFYEDKLSKTLQIVQASKSNRKTPIILLFLLISFLTSFLGYILIAIFEAIRAGVSFIPNFSAFFYCFILSILVFVMMIKSQIKKKDINKIEEKSIINKLEIIKQRKKDKEDEELKDKCQKIHKISKIKEINLETITTYIPTDENQTQKAKIIEDEELYEESIESNEVIEQKLRDNQPKVEEI